MSANPPKLHLNPPAREELALTSAEELINLYRSKNASPVEVLQAVLATQQGFDDVFHSGKFSLS